MVYIFTLSFFCHLQKAKPDSCGLAQDVLGGPFGVPSKYTPKNDTTPPLFLRGLYPLPFGGVARDCFSPLLNDCRSVRMGKKGKRPLNPVREFREKGQKKAVFRGPAGPRKRGLFWTLPWILKASN